MISWLVAEILCLLSFVVFSVIVVFAHREVDAKRALIAMVVSGFFGIVCYLMIATS